MVSPSKKAPGGDAAAGIGISGSAPGAVALALLVALGLAWAVRLIAIKAATAHGAAAFDVALVATAGVALLVTLVNGLRGRWPPATRRHLRFYLVAGVVGFGAPFAVELIVARHLPGLLFVLVVTSAPVWTVFIALVLRLEPAGPRRVVGVVAGFLATALVIAALPAAPDAPAGAAPLWIVAAFAIPVLYAAYVLFIAAAWPGAADNLQVAQGQAYVALAVFAGLAVMRGGTGGDLVALAGLPSVWLIVAAELVALVLFFRLARGHGGSFAAQANYVAVVGGAALSVLLFGEVPGWPALLGVGLLVLALRLASASSAPGGAGGTGASRRR